MSDSHIIERRLDQLDRKVDGIAEVLQSHARLEERNTSLTNITARHESWLKNHESRLRDREVSDSAQSVKVAGNSTLVWALIAAAGGLGGAGMTVAGKALITALAGG